MLRIAVCDDNARELERVEALTETWLSQHPELDGAICCFRSGPELAAQIRAGGGFDVYLLDVLMPGVDGIALGRLIRERDEDADIVYLSSSRDYAADSYGVRAFYYLLKPVGERQLFPILEEIAARFLRDRESTLPVRTHEGIVPVRIAEIAYAELRGRAVRCCLADGRSVVSQTLRGPFDRFVEPLLRDRRFIKVGASYVVNLSFVKLMHGHDLRMINGALIPVPRAAVAEVRDLYMNYLFERGRG